MRSVCLLVVLFCFNGFSEKSANPRVAKSSDRKGKHPHTGVIKAYVGEPPLVTLTNTEIKSVREGKPIYKTVEDNKNQAGRAVAVFMVNAPASKVWQKLSSFQFYPRWISGITKTKIYKRGRGLNANAGQDVFVEFKLEKPFINYTYFIKHDFPVKGRNWGTWKLDYDRESELSDSVGFWRVVPDQKNKNKSIVTYSVEIATFSWVPSFIKNMVKDQGLKEATIWVKEQSEKGRPKRANKKA